MLPESNNCYSSLKRHGDAKAFPEAKVKQDKVKKPQNVLNLKNWMVVQGRTSPFGVRSFLGKI